MNVSDLVGRARGFLRETSYVRAYMFDERFRALGKPEFRGSYLPYFCYAGLANRFRSHFAASLVGRELNRQVLPIWIKTMHLESDATDVFEEEWSKFRGGLPHGYVGVNTSSVLTGEFRSLAQSKQQLVVLGFDLQWLPIAETRRLFGPHESVEFRFRPNLVAAANELVASLRRPYLAVHIRQTDFIANQANYKPMSYYEAEIAKAVGGRADRLKYATLLVASDDSVNLDAALLAEFENVVILTPEKSRTEAGVASEALVHLLALGTSDGFVGTPRSSFSEFADAVQCGAVVVPGLHLNSLV
ncbi:O-fucosyltransferase family protein [Bradyrhizobium sp.]|uniref:O-fucosyltransferase family protein n=1 Tax=Bradyrhizobium sp. TaxID=376 RepID=UPI0039E2A429